MSSILYGIGVGPGDPELITVKGLRLLQSASCVFLPATRPGRSLAGAIIDGYLDRAQQEVVELVCPPYRDRAAVVTRWEELAATVAEKLAAGGSGVFVCEGDPSLYSTFLHLRRGLERRFPSVEIVTIPGVSAVNAAAALAGFPLATWDERLLITPAAHQGESLPVLLQVAESIAILKPGESLPALIDAIEDAGSTVRSALVRRAGWPEQQIWHGAAAMRAAERDYFSTLLIRRDSSRAS